MSALQSIAEQTIDGSHVPGAARAYLWAAAVAIILVCLCLGLAVCAGTKPPEGGHWKPYTAVVLGGLAIHIGYLLAPFAAQSGWWKWAFWTMTPLAVVVVLGILAPMVNSLRWTPPEGTSRAAGLLRMGVPGVIATLLYAGPPALLWWFRR